jgi:hypothetical protein
LEPSGLEDKISSSDDSCLTRPPDVPPAAPTLGAGAKEGGGLWPCGVVGSEGREWGWEGGSVGVEAEDRREAGPELTVGKLVDDPRPPTPLAPPWDKVSADWVLMGWSGAGNITRWLSGVGGNGVWPPGNWGVFCGAENCDTPLEGGCGPACWGPGGNRPCAGCACWNWG